MDTIVIITSVIYIMNVKFLLVCITLGRISSMNLLNDSVQDFQQVQGLEPVANLPNRIEERQHVQKMDPEYNMSTVSNLFVIYRF